MCDPITLTAATLTAASGAYSAYGQYKQGVAESKYYTYQQDQTRAQAEQALKQGEQQSSLIQDQAKGEGKQLAINQSKFNASQRAQMAAMGVTGGTAEDIAKDSFSTQKADELALRYNADIKSWQTNEEAKNRNWALNIQADQFGYASRNAKIAGKQKAFGTLLSTAASTAGIFV